MIHLMVNCTELMFWGECMPPCVQDRKYENVTTEVSGDVHWVNDVMLYTSGDAGQ